MRHTERMPDQAVFEQGDPVHGWFWLCEGRVRLARRTPAGKRQILREVHPGQVFGMEALAQDAVYDKTAVAVDDTWLISILTHDLPLALLRHPRLMAEISNSLIHQAIELQHRLKDALTHQTRERVVATLIHLVHRVSSASDSHDSTSAVTATNDELADMACTTPQTVSSCLSQLQRRGVIERRRGTIELLDLNALTDLIDLS